MPQFPVVGRRGGQLGQFRFGLADNALGVGVGGATTGAAAALTVRVSAGVTAARAAAALRAVAGVEVMFGIGHKLLHFCNTPDYLKKGKEG